MFAVDFRFGIYLKTCLFNFYSVDVFVFLILLSYFVGVHLVKENCCNEVFLMEFHHSCVNLCNLKCCRRVYREPNDGCMCACG